MVYHQAASAARHRYELLGQGFHLSGLRLQLFSGGRRFLRARRSRLDGLLRLPKHAGNLFRVSRLF